VRDFPGHIACDPNSRSELVVPLISAFAGTAGEVLGVLDLDSPLRARFDEVDQAGCERLAALFVDHYHRYSG
jgi:L-methionine (R)-S-oxide reductase